MIYYVYPLTFITPLHIGKSQLGGGLEQTQLVFGADALYSALCIELSGHQESLELFKSWVKNGKLRFSSLFPYYVPDNGEGAIQLYLPKPLRPLIGFSLPTSYASILDSAKQVKKNRHKAFVRTSALCSKSNHLVNESLYMEALPDFHKSRLDCKVNTRGEKPEPYYVGSISFEANSGLYFIVGLTDDSVQEQFESWLEMLSYSGIGGKRTSGYGKFILSEWVSEVQNDEYTEDDIRALHRMLHNDKPSFFLSISPTIPMSNEVDKLETGYVALEQKSGFIQSKQLLESRKRLSTFAVKEGSCLEHKINGSIIDVTPDGYPHPVERFGLSMQLGVNTHES